MTRIAELLTRMAALEARLEALTREAVERPPAHPRISDAIDVAAERFGVPREQILGDQRERRITKARHAAMLLAREECLRSVTVIARAFGCDHSSVIYGIGSARARVAREPDFAARLGAARASLNPANRSDA